MGQDFFVLWAVGKAVLAGLSPYAVNPPSLYPPTASIAFAVFALLPPTYSFAVFVGLNVVLLVNSLKRLKVKNVWSWVPFLPILGTFGLGQVSIIFFWLFSFLNRGDAWSALAGAMITLKPQAALIALPYFLVRWAKHQRRTLGYWFAATLALHLIPLVIRPTIYSEWLTSASMSGYYAQRFAMSTGLFALADVGIPIGAVFVLVIMVFAYAVSTKDEKVVRASLVLVNPIALWYDTIYLVGIAPGWLLIPLSLATFAVSAVAKNSLAFSVLPTAAFLYILVKRRQQQAHFPPCQ